jgi:hypothetical protein
MHPSTSNQDWFSAFFRAWLGVNLSLSVYAAVGLTCGAILAFFGDMFAKDVKLWFGIGFAASSAPVYLYFTSSLAMERALAQFKRWKEDGLIAEEDFADLKKELLFWYKLHRLAPRAKAQRALPRGGQPQVADEAVSAAQVGRGVSSTSAIPLTREDGGQNKRNPELELLASDDGESRSRRSDNPTSLTPVSEFHDESLDTEPRDPKPTRRSKPRPKAD